MEPVIDTIEEIDLATMEDELTPEQRAYWLRERKNRRTSPAPWLSCPAAN